MTLIIWRWLYDVDYMTLKWRWFDDVVIKPLDKGGAVVVWRADLYRQEALRQLNDASFYTKLNSDPHFHTKKLLKLPLTM